ncbi:MAG TPA: glycosyltransferase family 2 protein [Burkholderiales bacterium]|jgi:hypothetical protein
MPDPRYAPIAFFAYNRPEHTRRTLASLAANPGAADSALYAFSDGPRTADAVTAVAEVRALLRGLQGFSSVEVIERERNYGLAGSIVDGVGRLCASHGRVIVVEDDLLLSPHFLRYMNDGLARYESEPRVASIHGYTYPVDTLLPETFFMRGADCWGWATWARAWAVFEPDAGELLRQLEARKLGADFDFGGAAGNLSMLRNFIAGRNNSWAIRWHASAYLRDMLTLYPGRSLVRNIGHDGSGTHSGAVDAFDAGLTEQPVIVAPIEVAESPAARAAFGRYFRSLRVGLAQRVLRRLRRILGVAPKTA